MRGGTCKHDIRSDDVFYSLCDFNFNPSFSFSTKVSKGKFIMMTASKWLIKASK